MALLNISKQNKLLYDSNNGDGDVERNGEMGVMGHGLFPLVMEKIKLTISSKYQDMMVE